jgi:hypothetical protein
MSAPGARSPRDAAGGELPRGWEDDEPATTTDDDEYIDEDAIWTTPAQKALPPVFGRYDKDTGERLMHYSDDVIQNAGKDEEFDWTDSEGTSIDIGF